MLKEWEWAYFKTVSVLALVNVFLFYLQDNQIEIMVNKKASLRVSHELSIYLRYLHQGQNLPIRSLSQRYPQFSPPTIWRHATKKSEVHAKQTKGKGGRKPNLSLRDERSIIKSLHYGRKQDGNLVSKRIKKLYSGVSSVNDRTIYRVLDKYEYHYRQARRKGLLTENDFKLRMNLQKTQKSTMTMGCGRLEYVFVQMLSTLYIKQIEWIRQKPQ